MSLAKIPGFFIDYLRHFLANIPIKVSLECCDTFCGIIRHCGKAATQKKIHNMTTGNKQKNIGLND